MESDLQEGMQGVDVSHSSYWSRGAPLYSSVITPPRKDILRFSNGQGSQDVLGTTELALTLLKGVTLRSSSGQERRGVLGTKGRVPRLLGRVTLRC